MFNVTKKENIDQILCPIFILIIKFQVDVTTIYLLHLIFSLSVLILLIVLVNIVVAQKCLLYYYELLLLTRMNQNA